MNEQHCEYISLQVPASRNITSTYLNQLEDPYLGDFEGVDNVEKRIQKLPEQEKYFKKQVREQNKRSKTIQDQEFSHLKSKQTTSSLCNIVAYYNNSSSHIQQVSDMRGRLSIQQKSHATEVCSHSPKSTTSILKKTHRSNRSQQMNKPKHVHFNLKKHKRA